MKKFYDRLVNALPYLWGAMWIAIITVGSVATLIWVVQWFLRLVGVM